MSGTGRAALQSIAGELLVPSSGGIRLFSPGITQSPHPATAIKREVMVNNPDQDLGLAFNSSQSETALAGFVRTVVAFDD